MNTNEKSNVVTGNASGAVSTPASSVVFITGGSGFLGRRMIEELRKRGVVEVRALSRSEAASAKIRSAGGEPINCDMANVESLVPAMTGCSFVYHLAAKVEHWGNWDDFYQVNVVATRNIIEAAKRAKVKRLVHCSTEAVLVGAPIIDADETRPYSKDIRGMYPRSKMMAEQEAIGANGSELEVVVIRPRFIWGKGDTVLLPKLIEAVRTGSFKWISGGTNMTTTSNVANVVEGAILAAEKGKPGEIYFITDDESKQFKQFLGPIFQAAGVDAEKIGTVPMSLARIAAWTSEKAYSWLPLSGEPAIVPFILDLMAENVTVRCDKAKRELGYKPVIDYERGLQEIQKEYAEKKQSA